MMVTFPFEEFYSFLYCPHVLSKTSFGSFLITALLAKVFYSLISEFDFAWWLHTQNIRNLIYFRDTKDFTNTKATIALPNNLEIQKISGIPSVSGIISIVRILSIACLSETFKLSKTLFNFQTFQNF